MPKLEEKHGMKRVNDLAKEMNIDRTNLLKYIKKKNIPMVFIRTVESKMQKTYALDKQAVQQLKDCRKQDGYLEH